MQYTFVAAGQEFKVYQVIFVMKDIILAGISASGKGTQSQKLLNHFGDKLKYFETGWILRSLQSSDNAIGNHLKSITASWLLVKDEIISGLFGVFLETLGQWDVVLWDWCMRKSGQTKAIMWQLLQRKRDFVVIELVVPENVVYQRLENRFMCKDCGANFNKLIHGDITKCSECGWELYRRNDDSDNTAVENRLAVYRNDIVPALEMLDWLWRLVKIDWTQSIEKVFEEILEIVK